MTDRSARIRWSPRVPPHLIRRLYESDARGLLDEDLLNEVGFGMYARCADMLDIYEAERGQVKCRACRHVIQRRRGKRVERYGIGDVLEDGEAERLRCRQCGWQVTWGDYRKSFHGQRLDERGIEDILKAFVQGWPAAVTPGAKMLLIDRLIHEFHVHDGGERGVPLGVNVIDGNYDVVVTLLRELAYGPASTPGVQQTERQWRMNAKHLEYSRAKLQTMAREMGIRGYSAMPKHKLIAAIERIDPARFDQS